MAERLPDLLLAHLTMNRDDGPGSLLERALLGHVRETHRAQSAMSGTVVDYWWCKFVRHDEVFPYGASGLLHEEPLLVRASRAAGGAPVKGLRCCRPGQ